MTHPDRLLQSSSSSLVRDLLHSGLADAPSRDAAQRVALALGAGSSIVAGSGAAAAANAATHAAGAAGVAASSSGMGLVALASKALAVGTLVGLGLAGGAHAVSELAMKSSQQQPSKTAVLSRGAAQSMGQAARATPATAAVNEDAQPSAEASGRSAHANAPAARSRGELSEELHSDSGKLGQEVARIDAARRAVAARDPATALRYLDAYATADRTGTLDREAHLLRVEALVQSGRRQEAAGLFESYQQRYAADSYSEKMRALLREP